MGQLLNAAQRSCFSGCERIRLLLTKALILTWANFAIAFPPHDVPLPKLFAPTTQVLRDRQKVVPELSKRKDQSRR
ncbi:MAG: hypothetical protein ACRDHN_12290, partial [Thermomicrobiales bacterium]